MPLDGLRHAVSGIGHRQPHIRPRRDARIGRGVVPVDLDVGSLDGQCAPLASRPGHSRPGSTALLHQPGIGPDTAQRLGQAVSSPSVFPDRSAQHRLGVTDDGVGKASSNRLAKRLRCRQPRRRRSRDRVAIGQPSDCGMPLSRDDRHLPREHARTLDLGPGIRRHAAAAHHIERARMSSPLAAVRLSIASDGSSSTVDPSVDTSSPLRRHLSWMASA